MSLHERMSKDVFKQHVVDLLNQTSDYATLLAQNSQESIREAARGAPNNLKSAFEQRKRKRCSPVARGQDQCLSAVHLAIPRTPTQDLLPCLNGELRSHQLEGVKWLGNLCMSRLNGVLSDELLLDRQVQVVGLLALLKNRGIGGPFLIVASSSSLISWSDELHRLLPQGLLVHMYSSLSGSRDMMGLLCSCQGDQANPLTRVILMSYETFDAEQQSLQQYPVKHIVLDASSRQQVPQNVELAQRLQGKPGILLLTSSHPAQGSGQDIEDLWPLLQLVLPDSWRHIHAGVTELLSLAEELLPDIIGRIQTIVDRFVISRTAEEVDLAQPRRDTAINLYDYFSGSKA